MSVRTRKWIIVLTVVAFMLGVPMVAYRYLPEQEDSFFTLYKDNCAICHGENLEGSPQGPALVGVDLSHGDTVSDIRMGIAEGYPSGGMPAWSDVLRAGQLSSLAILVSEKRLNFDMTDLFDAVEIILPVDAIVTEEYNFRIEEFVANIDPYPFSIAPMPDGGFLLTEKTRGISIISPEGEQSALIEGTPTAYDDGLRLGNLEVGFGWLLDIALHPDYENNGWVYLHYGDRCGDGCNRANRGLFLPVSMNRLERARIRDGQWVEVETIWSAEPNTYTSMPDVGAGGRIAFDDQGHVFLSIGMKGSSNYGGIQDLSLPYGKIHRVNDDGSVPADNPFVVELGTSVEPSPGQTTDAMQTIWTYGHRSPQGLEFNFLTGELWGSEMGPRGGDEVNLLLPGRNYGWPLTSKGVNYNGTAVEYGTNLGIEFDINDIEQPVVDFSPSPAISSFVFYSGNAFSNWQDNIIIGSLKARELYWLVIEDDQLVYKETLIKGLARIRDIEIGADGLIYLLLENQAGGKIVRLVPE
ncbi:MAG: PQQ-dependent sugar dehydrogenase [Gammaproteobacteria bacterium]|jgi:glucose/arabinose dehydrogenase|nr:secretion protein HlyD [Gammaproteobacteria bacterium]MDP6096106.1 PQQ-dependent sugar dehydrogenase [Gammaproteobacteria bacterium]MDP7455369.1 PQQ-dependent sugar dehydrogenase [Gammaproteobacteria bacterium]HJO11716.1 PQQ-dependent sugar dehydrogenase [Gammaproteobacteria bacterium]|tara:strand:+ start:4280 stop:5851 length:1572 start_codon:yes stop_codon:yes gene_type:complete